MKDMWIIFWDEADFNGRFDTYDDAELVCDALCRTSDDPDVVTRIVKRMVSGMVQRICGHQIVRIRFDN